MSDESKARDDLFDVLLGCFANLVAGDGDVIDIDRHGKTARFCKSENGIKHRCEAPVSQALTYGATCWQVPVSLRRIVDRHLSPLNSTKVGECRGNVGSTLHREAKEIVDVLPEYRFKEATYIDCEDGFCPDMSLGIRDV